MSQSQRVVADNRKARRDYFIDDKFEAGIVLMGSEVKSLREGRANIADSYAAETGGELFLLNAYIPEYSHSFGRFGHETRRPRKLLMHRRQIGKLIGTLQRGGMTLVPLSLYFNERGRAKVQLGLARGKKLHDKRATDREREWKREQGRLMRQKG